ncbi:unnamed protein product [Cyprideis torosa]|uniref:Uncharacterized protein n=1 Tax=Cyprideis torosa TaxID=163714 RepID=A0A7R8W5X8_9CRUS|nr:unnamed protein product [Cyprideis torosa]CAG0885863.1 unnamed protein product [Cyprideis torosa]
MFSRYRFVALRHENKRLTPFLLRKRITPMILMKKRDLQYSVTILFQSGGLALSVPAKLFCGAMSGAIAQTFSYPLDVTRRRMQLSGMVPEFQKFSNSMLKTLKLVYLEFGIRDGLYKGMSVNYIRAVPMVSVSFTTYEVMKQLLHLDTGASHPPPVPITEATPLKETTPSSHKGVLPT